MCLAQGPQRSDAGEAQTRGPSVSSQALYHWATVLPITHDKPWHENAYIFTHDKQWHEKTGLFTYDKQWHENAGILI